MGRGADGGLTAAAQANASAGGSYAPLESSIYMSQLTTAGDDSAAIDISAASEYYAGQTWVFYSAAPWYVVFGGSGISAAVPATAAAPGSGTTGVCVEIPGGALVRLQLGQGRTHIRWQSTVDTQRLRFWAASLEGI